MRKNDKLIEIIKNTLTGEKLKAFNHVLDTHKRILLVTGSAGAGKTDVLVSSYMGLMLKGHKVCCMASTALAAVNINNRYKRKIEEISEIIDNESLKKILRSTEKPHASTIHSTMDIKPEKFYMPSEDGFDLNAISQHKTRPRGLDKLMNYDSIFIDEVSMISANFMDVIMYMVSVLDKERVEKNKKPLRIILFGDFYQLSPVVSDWDYKLNKEGKTICELYKEKYGGVYLFDCKRLSERWLESGKRFGKNYYFELKENHRIDVSGGTERQKRLNCEYRKHLSSIKEARYILRKADTAIYRDDINAAIRELIPLNDAIEFFNKRQMSRNEFKKRKDVKNMLKVVGESKVITIAGTNAFRKEMTDYITELFVENYIDNKISKGLEGTLSIGTDYINPEPKVFRWKGGFISTQEKSEVLRIGFPLSQCELVKNMKVVITKNCKGLSLKGDNPISLFNGQVCSIDSFEKTDEYGFIPIVKNEEGILIRVFPKKESKQRIEFKKLLTKDQEKELKEKLSRTLINGKYYTIEELKEQPNYTIINFTTGRTIQQEVKNYAFKDNNESTEPVVYNNHLYRYFGANYFNIEKLPLEPAFALTYHKVQGQEANCIYIHSKAKDFIDQNSLYLGLSRGKSIKGLWISQILPRPLKTTKDGKLAINFEGKQRLARILKYHSKEQKETDLNKSIDDKDYERKEMYYTKKEMFDADRFLDKFKPGSSSASVFPHWYSLS